MNRFIAGSEEAKEILQEVRQKWFPLLEQAIIKILFDTKKRTSGGKIVLGRILKANDLIRRLTDNLAEEGCDYILFLDEVAFVNIPAEDKIRLVRHELRHCKVIETKKGITYKIIPHDLEDFTIEVKLNEDKIDWAKNAVQLTADIYDQIEDARKDEENMDEKKKTPLQQSSPDTSPKKVFSFRKTI